MKKPIHLTWSFRLIILILCVTVIYLFIKSFKEGYEEGRQMRLKEMQEKLK